MSNDLDRLAINTFLLVAPSDRRAHELISIIKVLLNPPPVSPQDVEVCGLLVQALQFTIGMLDRPTQLARQYLADAEHLHRLLVELKDDAIHSTRSTRNCSASKHPVWYQLAKAASLPIPPKVMLLYFGCSFLVAAQGPKPVSNATTKHLRDLMDVHLSSQALGSLVSGFTPAELQTESWTNRLCNLWREVVKQLSAGDVPHPSLGERVVGQLLGSALNPSPAHAAGSQTHRQLSALQFRRVCEHIRDQLKKDELAGVLGILVIRTSFTVDVLVQLPIASQEDRCSRFYLDTCKGILVVDLQTLVHEPAQPLAGCLSGGFKVNVQLPQGVAAALRKRSDQYPSARTLKDLYPEAEAPDTFQCVVDRLDEIPATWARLRYSTSPHLLHLGFNGLNAAVLTLDFSLVCRSKLHYAVISKEEWHHAQARLYQCLGLDVPVDPEVQAYGIGSRVVPLKDTVRLHDANLVSLVNAARPSPRAAYEALLKFHNSYTKLTGWRLSIVLALRASARLSLPASLNTEDLWIAMHDKSTTNDRGHQPIPLSDFARETIRLYQSHCHAMADRLDRLGLDERMQANWCRAVGEKKNLRLLCLLDQRGRTSPLSSKEFTRSLTPDYELPPDPGRKILENLLRERGLPSTPTDQMLRHTKVGQVHLSSFNPTPLSTSIARLSAAIQLIATELFETPAPGLRRS